MLLSSARTLVNKEPERTLYISSLQKRQDSDFRWCWIPTKRLRLLPQPLAEAVELCIILQIVG